MGNSGKIQIFGTFAKKLSLFLNYFYFNKSVPRIAFFSAKIWQHGALTFLIKGFDNKAEVKEIYK